MTVKKFAELLKATIAKSDLVKIMQRCSWVGEDKLYQNYHDEEWGVPVYDENKLFEFLTLESFQAGLSWLTILKKRENFRRAFASFDPSLVANFTDKDKQRLLANEGIIRNKQKIEAAINNAQQFILVQMQKSSFSDYMWSFVEGSPIQNSWQSDEDIPVTTPLAIRISNELKTLGFKFAGPTIIYAHMQATGMVNDHTIDCFRYNELQSDHN